jgi:hypothetical protein
MTPTSIDPADTIVAATADDTRALASALGRAMRAGDGVARVGRRGRG